MDFQPTASQKQMLDDVRAFVEREMIPLEAEVRDDTGLTPESLRALQAKGQATPYWMPDVPTEFGGRGFNVMTQLLMQMELTRALLPAFQPINAFNFGWCKGAVMLFAGTPEQQEKYLYPVLRNEKTTTFALTEPGAGSDGTGITTEAVRDGDRYVINGVKSLINGGSTADFLLLFCVTDPGKRARGGISCILVDRGTPGFTVSRRITAMVPTNLAELTFENCVVPTSQLLGEEGKGFQLGMQWVSTERLYSGVYCVGKGSRLLEMAVKYAEERTQFGQPLVDYQAIQFMLADSMIDVYTAKWATLQAGAKADRGEDIRTEASMVKAYGANAIGRVADRIMQLYGGWGVTGDFPIERVYRESRVHRIIDGTDEIQKVTMVKGLRRGWRP